MALREGLERSESRRVAGAGRAASRAAFTVALAIAGYDAAGADGVALAVLARALPGALAGPRRPAWTPREEARRTLVVAALFAGAAGAAAAGAPLAILLAVAAVLAIVARDGLPVAGAGAHAQDGAASIVGVVAGAAVCAAASVAAAFALAGAAAALAWTNPIAAGEDARRGSARARLPATLRALRGTAALRAPLALLAAVGVACGALEVLAVVVALEHVNGGLILVGVLSAAWIAGGLVIARVPLARAPLGTALDASAMLVGAPLALIAAVASPVVAVVAFAVLGAGAAVAGGAGARLARSAAPDPDAARDCVDAVAGPAVALGAAAAPLLLGALGVRGALLVTALVVPVAVIGGWRALRLDGR